MPRTDASIRAGARWAHAAWSAPIPWTTARAGCGASRRATGTGATTRSATAASASASAAWWISTRSPSRPTFYDNATYDGSLHPHAVTSAGGDSFGYNAVGNQDTRPGGVTVTYTPFDLPRTVTQATGTVSFGYDGDQRRIRKTTPMQEILYFGDLYERSTDQALKVTHRYYIHSPERVVAIVTRGGDEPGTRYVHTDHLGSVDALTKADGDVVERRSYDAFGQRRNSEWGAPPPASFETKTTLGFTGHESDDELGLVNMKGRVLDRGSGAS
jgi:YD repeat-containing protein